VRRKTGITIGMIASSSLDARSRPAEVSASQLKAALSEFADVFRPPLRLTGILFGYLQSLRNTTLADTEAAARRLEKCAERNQVVQLPRSQR
jgi:hypothetical protein